MPAGQGDGHSILSVRPTSQLVQVPSDHCQLHYSLLERLDLGLGQWPEIEDVGADDRCYVSRRR
jgi:hypothetical protein